MLFYTIDFTYMYMRYIKAKIIVDPCLNVPEWVMAMSIHSHSGLNRESNTCTRMLYVFCIYTHICIMYIYSSRSKFKFECEDLVFIFKGFVKSRIKVKEDAALLYVTKIVVGLNYQYFFDARYENPLFFITKFLK